MVFVSFIVWQGLLAKRITVRNLARQRFQSAGISLCAMPVSGTIVANDGKSLSGGVLVIRNRALPRILQTWCTHRVLL